MSPDDFDGDPNNFTAPIPPHERQWRHPSEMRSQAAPHVTVPPVQREFRLIAIGSACLSVVISLVLLGVVSPRPLSVDIQERSAFIAPDTTSLPMPVGSASIGDLRSVIPHLSDSAQPVIAMRQTGYFLSSAVDMKKNLVIGIVDSDGRGITAQVVSIDQKFGIAWLRRLNLDSTYATKSLTISPPTTVMTKIAHGDVIWIIDRDVTTAIIGLSTKNLALTKHLWPIDSPPDSKLSGLAVDDQGRAIGWCVYVNGAQWVIPMAMLEDFLHEVDIASFYERP
jgi:hypothetical protein